MRKYVVALLIAVGAAGVLMVASIAGASSGKNNVTADVMIGYHEAPSISTAASGSFEATIDDDAQTIEYTLSYSGLEGDVRQAHIHFAQRGISGGISAWLCETTVNPSPTGPATPDCVQSGTVTGVIRPADVIGPSGQGIAANEFNELVAALRAGFAYANVHSSKFTGGEIRGQINDDDQRE
jgi:CHRD domain